MMGKSRIVLTALFLCCAAPLVCFAQCSTDANGCASEIPHLIRYVGQVKNAFASSHTGVVSLKFTIYDSEKGGTALWQEVQNTQADMLGRSKYSSEQHPAREFRCRYFPMEDSAGWEWKSCDPDRKRSRG